MEWNGKEKKATDAKERRRGRRKEGESGKERVREEGQAHERIACAAARGGRQLLSALRLPTRCPRMRVAPSYCGFSSLVVSGFEFAPRLLPYIALLSVPSLAFAFPAAGAGAEGDPFTVTVSCRSRSPS